MARRDVLLRVLGDPDGGKNAIREVLREVEEFDGTEASARLILRKQNIEAEIEKVKKRLANLSKQEATPKVTAKIARAVEQLDRLELKLDKLDAKDVKVDVDVGRGTLERMAGLFRTIDRSVDHSFRRIPFLGGLISAPFKVARIAVAGLATAIDVLPRLVAGAASAISSGLSLAVDSVRGLIAGTTTAGQVMGSVASGLIAIGTQGAAAAVGLITAALALAVLGAAAQALLGLLAAVAGLLGALVASLALAAGGFVALGVAAAALFGPALLVAIALIQRFAAVLEARKAREQELQKAVEDQKTAEQQRTAAAGAAQQAQERLTQATVEGNRAMAQSARDLVAAQDNLRSSKLSVDEARLAWARARKELRDFIQQAGVRGPTLNALTKKFTDVDFDPSQAGRALGDAGGAGGKVDALSLQEKILAAKRAQESYRESLHHVTQAEADLSKSQRTRADYLNRGIRAYGPYRQALHQNTLAQTRLLQAEQKVSAAHTTYDQKVRQLNATEKGFLGTLTAFVNKFKELAQVVTKPIFDGLAVALGAAQRVMADPAVQRGLGAIGQAIGDFFRNLARTLSSREWREAFAYFAQSAARAIGSGGRALSSFLDILRIIARAAMPTLLRLLGGLADKFSQVASRPGRIRAVVATLIEHFRIWLSIAGHLAGIVIGFFRAAAGTGGRLSGHIRDIVRHFDHWINSRAGQERVRRFLRDSVSHVRHLLQELPKVLDAFKHIADVVNAIADATKKVWDFLKFNSGESMQTKVNAIAADRDIIERESGLLKRHLSPDQRSASRTRLAEALRDLKTHASLPPALQKILDRLAGLGFGSGGYTGADGGFVHPREFVLREAITAAIGIPRLNALNAGIPPQLVFAGAPAGESTSIGSQHNGDRHYHFQLTRAPRGVDELMDEMEREISLAGG